MLISTYLSVFFVLFLGKLSKLGFFQIKVTHNKLSIPINQMDTSHNGQIIARGEGYNGKDLEFFTVIFWQHDLIHFMFNSNSFLNGNLNTFSKNQMKT